MGDRKSIPVLGIIVPCFNEEKIIESTAGRLRNVLKELAENKKIDPKSFICFVDDGSRDGTWGEIKRLHDRHDYVKGLKLSRNEGHQAAILAGLMGVRGKVDCAVTIDADLQQDETRIPSFIDEYANGAEIVFGVRKDRSTDSFMKRFTAVAFYRVMGWMGVPLVKGHADYRLVSSRVLDVIAEYGEVNIFLRGIFANLGFKTSQVFYEVRERTLGETKYTYRKMFRLATDGITSFSVVPLRIVAITGFAVSFMSVIMILFAFLSRIMPGMTVRGWSSTMISLYFLGGLQILSLGIIGEYIGKIYHEVKRRPRFLTEEVLD